MVQPRQRRISLSLLENQRMILKERATGLPTVENFELIEDPASDPGPDEGLVHNTSFRYRSLIS